MNGNKIRHTQWHRMTITINMMTGLDCAVVCILINTHTRPDRAGLRGYVQFNKYTHTRPRLIRGFRNKYH